MHRITRIIDDSIAGKSKLIPDILSIQGMSSARNRHLLNNILNRPAVNYLEIGVWHGSTFISAMYKNEVNSAYAIDNWSEYNDQESKRSFINNCQEFDINNYSLFECDAFQLDLSLIKDKINIYFYDGDHNQDETRKALTYFLPVLADKFLFIADDYRWSGVNVGVNQGIKECKLKIVRKWELDSNGNDKDGWWNGLGIFILKNCGT